MFLHPHLDARTTAALESASLVHEIPPQDAEQRIASLEHMVATLSGWAPRRGRLLDVGSGRGFALEAARRSGWSVMGVEFAPKLAARARSEFGVPVAESLEAAREYGPFDFALLWHVLEHIHDPLRFLNAVRSLLEPDGVLAVQVPSFEYLEYFRASGRMTELVCAVHVLQFTEGTLRAVLERASFQIDWIHTASHEWMLTAIASPLRSTRGRTTPTTGSSLSTVDMLRRQVRGQDP